MGKIMQEAEQATEAELSVSLAHFVSTTMQGGMEILSVTLEGNYFDLCFIEGKSAMQRIMLESYSKRLMHSLKESLRAGSAGVRILFLERQTRKAGLFKALFSDTCL